MPTDTPTATPTPTNTPTPTATPTTGVVGGHVWEDANRDGQRQADEGGIPGITVRLEQVEVRRGGLSTARETATNAEDYYRFEDVMSSRYLLSFSPGGYRGYLPTTDSVVDISAGANVVVTSDFGLYPLPYPQYLPLVQH